MVQEKTQALSITRVTISNDSSALYQNMSNTNQDLLTSPPLLLYLHGFFGTVKQLCHNVNFKNDALCKTHAAVFKRMVQMYLFSRSSQSNLYALHPGGINYCLHR